MSEQRFYRKILVAVDFSPGSEAALHQAVWLARHSKAQITLVHTLPDLRKVVHSASVYAKLDLLFGEGNEFYRQIRKGPDVRMRQMVDRLDTSGLDTAHAVRAGEPRHKCSSNSPVYCFGLLFSPYPAMPGLG